MAGQKRARSGSPKPQATATTATPPCGQRAQQKAKIPSKPTHTKQQHPPHAPPTQARCRRKNPAHHTTTATMTKRPLLPPHATIHKRPLLHPPIPSPFAAASAQKTLYITASSPFVPACKRIRALLVEVQKRSAQSASSAARGRVKRRGANVTANVNVEANGRLAAKDVEAGIAAAAAAAGTEGRSAGSRGEEVYVKATGRAIPRALELGVKFQGQGDCLVRVEMGSVQAIDDVERRRGGVEGQGEGGASGGEEEELPETRIRTLSTVTVCIGLV